jgi:hypothetical protein
MYKMQDYYGEVETAPCDPYYEDCDEVVEDGELVDGEELVEDSEAVPIMVMAWGLVPLFDILAGFWNMSEWSDSSLSEWDNVYLAELGFGTIGLVLWGGAVFMGAPFESIFVISSKVQIIEEALMLYLVYNAEDSYANADYVDSQATNFAYMAHALGLAYSAVAFREIDSYFGGDEEELAEDEEGVYGDEELAVEGEDEEAQTDYYGYY